MARPTKYQEAIMQERITDSDIAVTDNTPEKNVKVLGQETDIHSASIILEAVKHAVVEVVKHKVIARVSREDVISAAETTAEAIVKGMTFMIHGQK
ncbi:hypothetical protein [Xenorhabdus indica]|uniref:hypothetical protein n=1 Tax=Xenorhabdus indica TaxID=333964 RepID=UPI001657475F|nr:hypothetical protein [Xenorhabdus indica]MBC8947210.1 transcriptional regulator [Xenorhabdus indica]